jgi:hypothetical protein
VPVPRDGTGVFGDRPCTGVPEYWVDFGQWGAWHSNVSLLKASWIQANTSHGTRHTSQGGGLVCDHMWA